MPMRKGRGGKPEWRPPTLREMAGWGGETVGHHASLVGNQKEDAGTQLSDALSDIMHWARSKGLDWDEEYERALRHFEMDVRGEP